MSRRLLLRTPVKSDAAELLEFRNSDYILRYNPMSVRTLKMFEQELIESGEAGECLVLELKETGRAIGAVYTGADELRYGVDSIMLSYWLGEPYVGKGYMSEALKALIESLRSAGRYMVSARVFDDNIASKRLVEKLGFRFEGTLHNAVKCGGIIHDDCLYAMMLSV